MENRDDTPVDQIVTGVLDNADVVLPLEGLVDLDVEKTRLLKAIDDAEKHLSQVETKLENENFRKKAPKAIVEKEEQRQNSISTRIVELRERLAELR